MIKTLILYNLKEYTLNFFLSEPICFILMTLFIIDNVVISFYHDYLYHLGYVNSVSIFLALLQIWIILITTQHVSLSFKQIMVCVMFACPCTLIKNRVLQAFLMVSDCNRI